MNHLHTTQQQIGNGPRYAAINGLLYIMFFMAGLIVLNVGNHSGVSYPTPWSPDAHIHAFFAGGVSASAATAALHSLAAIALLAFSSVLAGKMADFHFGNVPSKMIQAGGVSAALCLLLSAVASWLLSRPEVLSDISTLRLVQNLGFAAGGVAHIISLTLMIGVPSVIAFRTRWLPRMVSILGIVVTLAALLSHFVFVSPDWAVMLPIARFGSLAWIAQVSILLIRK